MKTLTEKLHPSQFTAMSPRMAQIVGCVLDEDWAVPRLDSLMITSDGWVLGQAIDDVGFNHHIGSVEDLERNWKDLLDAARLTKKERTAVTALYRKRVEDHRCPNRRCAP